MLYFLTATAYLLAGILSLIVLYLIIELSSGLVQSRKSGATASPVIRHGVILVPAHNEAIGIAATIKALHLVAPRCRIVVVADNCTDATAELALDAGAEVISRHNTTQKGKGYALAFGCDYLAKAPPEVVIVIDADCRLSEGGADVLMARALSDNQPIQAAYCLTPSAADTPLSRISNFAMLVKNIVRAGGLERLAGGTLLFGSGMAFPWTLFATMNLASSHAVEDLELVLALAKRGICVGLEKRAYVSSPAVSGTASVGQRSRWEHGFLQTAIESGLPMMASGVRKGSRHLFFIGAHMMVPPLAMLMLITVAAMALLGMLSLVTTEALIPLGILAACVGLLATTLCAAWWREGRDVISGRTLLKIPMYMLWKLPIYMRFFTARQTGWNRTQRDGEQQ